MKFETLAKACDDRAKEWDAPALPLSYLSNEMGGEVGEAIERGQELMLDLARAAGRIQNITKKLDRARYGMAGSKATIEELAKECGDVQICLMRLSRYAGFDLGDATRHVFNAKSVELGFKTMVPWEE